MSQLLTMSLTGDRRAAGGPQRSVNLRDLVGRHPRAQLSVPGDVILTVSPRPALWWTQTVVQWAPTRRDAVATGAVRIDNVRINTQEVNDGA